MNYGKRKYPTKIDEDTGYKYVYKIISRSGEAIYEARLKNNKRIDLTYYKTAKEAAKAVDLNLVKQGKEPINGTIKKRD